VAGRLAKPAPRAGDALPPPKPRPAGRGAARGAEGALIRPPFPRMRGGCVVAVV